MAVWYSSLAEPPNVFFHCVILLTSGWARMPIKGQTAPHPHRPPRAFWQTFAVKGQIVNILDSEGHKVSVATTQLGHTGVSAATDKM